MQSVFHGIRLLRLIKIGCRETINFFVPIHEQIVMVLKMAHLEEVGMSHRLSKQGSAVIILRHRQRMADVVTHSDNYNDNPP